MKLLSIAALVAALTIIPTLAQAGKLDDLKAVFDNHCSAHGLSLSCAVSREHSATVDNPDIVIYPANASRGPRESACGFEQIAIPMPGGRPDYCVADYSSWMTTGPEASITDGGTHDEFTCTTKTGTISLFPPKLTGTEVTVAGHCH